MIDNNLIDKLYKKAKAVSENSHSPYSKFRVGAAVLSSKGGIYIGTNIENASYGLTICAERNAIASAIAEEGADLEIIAIVIYAPVKSAPPCGACRQYIIEFGNAIEVFFPYEDVLKKELIKDLLPYKFSL